MNTYNPFFSVIHCDRTKDMNMTHTYVHLQGLPGPDGTDGEAGPDGKRVSKPSFYENNRQS